MVCVYNDRRVLEACLQKSVADLRASAPRTQLIRVDNTRHTFASAGAALAHGAAQATNEFVVLAHQDVVLHSLTALEQAAGLLADRSTIGLVGACGIDAHGRIQGRIRDRVVLIGEHALNPTLVDSVDEVLFVVRRSDLATMPLATSHELAWHAYAVEYGVRMRGLGRDVVVTDIPLTHNSLTINLDRLDVAHRAVAIAYPDAMPVRTTCGVITAPKGPPQRKPLLETHRWRYRWLRESVTAGVASLRSHGRPVVLADIRLDIDDLLDALYLSGALAPLRIINVETGAFTGTRPVGELLRRGRVLTVSAESPDDAVAELDAAPDGTSLMLTNVEGRVLGALGGKNPLLGYSKDTGLWALTGPAAHIRLPAWRTARATPALRRRQLPSAVSLSH